MPTTGTFPLKEADYLQDNSGNNLLDNSGNPIGFLGIDELSFTGTITSVGITGTWISYDLSDGNPVYIVDGSGNYIVDQFGNKIIAGNYGTIFNGMVGNLNATLAATDLIDQASFIGTVISSPSSGVRRIERSIKKKIEWVLAKEIVEKVYDRDLQWMHNIDFNDMMPAERSALIDTVAQGIEFRYLVDKGMLLTDLYAMMDDIKKERQEIDDEEAIAMLLEDA